MTDTTQGTPTHNRAFRRFTVLAMLVAVLGVTACGGKDTAKPNPSKAAVALSAGLEAQTAGKLDEAVDHYNEALKYEAKNKYALYDLALVDEARSNYGAAEDKYRVVLAIDPAYEPALFNLAILQKAKGEDKSAIELYRRAITAVPKDAAAHLNLGLLLRANSQKAAGDALVKQAIKLNPKLRDPAATVTKSPSAEPPAASPSTTKK
jgi:tetratricopeptide (TPR) repeat protein